MATLPIAEDLIITVDLRAPGGQHRESWGYVLAVDGVSFGTAAVQFTAPLLVALLLFQRQFMQSFMRAGIR